MFDFGELAALGVGVGLRREHYAAVLEQPPRVDWFEVISENFMEPGGRPLKVLERVRADFPIALHGVSMSLGVAGPLDHEYLHALDALVRRFDPIIVSDHLCWTRNGNRNLHDLLPLPHTEESVEVVAQNITQAQNLLGRRILIENISTYLTYTHSTMAEWEFLTAVAEAAGCGILLDINNIFVNAFNHRFSAEEYIDAIPAERVAQFHLAGHRDCATHLLDTHDQPVCDAVWRLYERALHRFGRRATLIEWDDALPDFATLQDEAERARSRFEKIPSALTRGP